MKISRALAHNALFGILAVVTAPSAFAQLVGAAACSTPLFALPLFGPFACTFPPSAVQQPAFRNVYVFRHATPKETWDEHLAAFLQANPQFGPPTSGSPTVNCMNGTNSPCLQDLTSEAIDAITTSIIGGGYFQAMQDSYGMALPIFIGDANPVSIDGQPASGCAGGIGQTPTYFTLSSFIECAFPGIGTFTTAPQLNLILAPDFDPPLPLTADPTQAFNGTQLCNPPAGTDNAYHSTVFPMSPSAAGFLNCVEAAAVPSPFGPVQAFLNCVNVGAAEQCAEEAAAAGTAGPLVCGVLDALLGLPGACEGAVTGVVSACIAEATNVSFAQQVLAGEINFTVIPTSPACFGPKMAGLNQPRQILGGLPSTRTATPLAGGLSSPLDMISKAISHEMVETITDPAGAGWVDFNFTGADLYSKGEVSDMCQPNGVQNSGTSPVTQGIAAYMPFKFLHVSRYWSNANNACMPNFDSTVPLSYSYSKSTNPHTVSLTASVSGGALDAGGFWGAGLGFTEPITQFDTDKLRVTNLARLQVPRNSALQPPAELGNSIDSGGGDPQIVLSVTNVNQANILMIVPTSATDPLVLELWDDFSGQGCPACAAWPAPTTCTVAVQPVSAAPQPGGTGTSVILNAETLAYGLSEPPLDGVPTYAVVLNGVATNIATQTLLSDLGTAPCTAILPCNLTVNVPNGTTSFSITSSDAISPPPGTSIPATTLPPCTSNPIPVSSIPPPPTKANGPPHCSSGETPVQCGSGVVCLAKGEDCSKFCTSSEPWCKEQQVCESAIACRDASNKK